MPGISLRVAAVVFLLASPALVQAALTLSAKDLYGGFDARRVLLDEKAGTLSLDPLAIKSKSPGIIQTDPLDLVSPGEVLGRAGALEALDLAVAADVPKGAAVAVEVRTGPTMFDTTGWCDWMHLKELTGKVGKPAGRYAQVRITLTGAAGALPAVKSLTLTPTLAAAAGSKPLTVTDAKIQTIVRSPIDFKYERPDTPKLAAFRKAANLDKVVEGAKDDFEKLVKLMDWVGSCKNDREAHKEWQDGVYQWDIDKVFEVKDGKPMIYGHCMSYCEVLVTAATAMGYVSARHMAMVGFREASHEVCDIWTPSLGKWVYYDPSLSNYYFDKKTKTPLNLVEMHQVVADAFVPEGRTMNWFIARGNAAGEETKAQVRKVGGKEPIGCRLGPWKYGAPMPADYDWGWGHGYLAAGFVAMTPRNDFNSNPKAMSKHFQSLPGYDGFPVWVDAKTPPRNSNWYTRMRDFYWTLDQASVRLVQTADDTLAVELGQSMPFFKSYRLRVDGAEVKDAASPFTWKLKAGKNTLEVAPVDEFGKVGLASSVTVSK